ncbi:MAG: 30S ribosomal protein S21 [Leptospiraceae bacterium]|nr:30S ribosomal protein S21 [Leptospiraceae bacterium]
MIGVVIKDGEPVEVALKRFKRECVNAGIQSEIKRREFFEKPSKIKKRKVDAAIRKRRKKRIIMQRRDRNG